jgi:ATP-dependent RNA helicase DOB1
MWYSLGAKYAVWLSISNFSGFKLIKLFFAEKGAKFIEICKMTDIFEGSIIRCMRRLEELLRQMCSAAKAIGNAELEAKFSDSISKIKRDIVFAVSLYL